jgi:signal transduction histidine kinase
MVSFGSWVFVGYLAAFAAATIGCGVALLRAVRVADDDTRRGLVGLVAGAGGWALCELVFLAAPTRTLKYVAYDFSLVVGLSTVGAWLYFCSAYTGRSFHRERFWRHASVATYLGIVSLKLTNPLHGHYFSVMPVEEPFAHLAIQHGTFHWLVSGLSYALVAVGFFMLFELFLEADYDTRPLGVLVAITGLPVLFDVLAFATPLLIDINYEPLGVAVFAVGVLYAFETEFLAVQLTDGVDDAVVYLDDTDRIREYNGHAEDVFPELGAGTGESFPDVLPSVAAALDDEPSIVDRAVDGQRRHFLVNDTAFTLGQSDIGRMVVFSDVTESERHRRELERQNEQLEGFAAAIRHELLNTLQIVAGRVDIAGHALESGDIETARESLRVTESTTDRMTDIVEDLSVLARHGKTLGDTEAVGVEEALAVAWDRADADDLSLSAAVDGEVVADRKRFRELLRNAVEFAARNGASEVRVERDGDTLVLEDDGEPLGEADPKAYFEYGSAVPNTQAGITLPNVRTLAAVHGWEAGIDTDYEGGVRVVVEGVDGVEAPDVTAA